MKVIINAGFGGFGLSPAAVKRIAELKGRPCFLFKQESGFNGPFIPLVEGGKKGPLGIFYAFDIPNPNEVLKDGDWSELTMEQRCARNEKFRSHSLADDPERNDPHLVQAVEELKTLANGQHATLKVVEIPDGVEWEIDDYDGSETIREKHRSWA